MGHRPHAAVFFGVVFEEGELDLEDDIDEILNNYPGLAHCSWGWEYVEGAVILDGSYQGDDWYTELRELMAIDPVAVESLASFCKAFDIDKTPRWHLVASYG